jgi:hypothetical protein
MSRRAVGRDMSVPQPPRRITRSGCPVEPRKRFRPPDRPLQQHTTAPAHESRPGRVERSGGGAVGLPLVAGERTSGARAGVSRREVVTPARSRWVCLRPRHSSPPRASGPARQEEFRSPKDSNATTFVLWPCSDTMRNGNSTFEIRASDKSRSRTDLAESYAEEPIPTAFGPGILVIGRTEELPPSRPFRGMTARDVSLSATPRRADWPPARTPPREPGRGGESKRRTTRRLVIRDGARQSPAAAV